MAMVLISGSQELYMKANGKIISRMAKEYFGIVLGRYILANSPKTEHMDTAFICIKMGHNTKENG